MENSVYDVAIIGAGHNGLICGAYLAKAGLKVILLEARHETGGGLDTLEFAGFKHNPHAIYHIMAEVMPAYEDFSLKARGVKYIYPEVQASYITKGQKPILFYKDPKKTSAYLSSEFSPKDGEEYARMYADFEEFCEKILMPLTYVPAVPPVDQVVTLDKAKDDVGRRFNEIAELTPLDILDMYDLSKPVKAAVLNLYTMWGSSPDEALGYLFPLNVYRMTNAALVSGGSHRLSSAISKAIFEAGGYIREESTAKKIILTNGKVEGVLLTDGTEIKANVVASTVDPHQTFLTFFDEGEIPENLRESARKWEWEKMTFFGAHLSLREAPKYIGTEGYDDANRAMVTHLGVEDVDSILEHHRSIEDGELPTGTLMGHTTCTSIFDPIMAPKGFHAGRWESLVPYDHDWEENKWDYARLCTDQWKEYAPNLDPINTLVYPPTYIEGKIMNMVRGSFKQGAYIPLQMGYFRPNESCSQGFTPIDGLYVCGASSYPGGMILGGAGYIGANVIAEDFGIEKWWKEPEIVAKARERGLIQE